MGDGCLHSPDSTRATSQVVAERTAERIASAGSVVGASPDNSPLASAPSTLANASVASAVSSTDDWPRGSPQPPSSFWACNNQRKPLSVIPNSATHVSLERAEVLDRLEACATTSTSARRTRAVPYVAFSSSEANWLPNQSGIHAPSVCCARAKKPSAELIAI